MCSAKIMIADDDQLNRMMLEKLMQRFNAECSMAKDGKDAVGLFETASFDAVFLDVNMPVYSGPECAQMIRKKCADAKIDAPLIVCISADDEYTDSAIFDFFLSKPFSIDDIKELIDTINQCKCGGHSYNIDEVAEIIGLDRDTMVMLMHEFIEVFNEEIVNLKNSITDKDSDMITHVAHKMKGAAANMHIETIRELCAQLQNLDKRNIKQTHMLYSKIYCAYRQFKLKLSL